MADLVYPPVIALAKGMFRGLGLTIVIEGAENIPRSGPAVLVSNHIGYLDFTFCGLAAQPSRRLVRFMAKDAVFRHPVSGPLMRGMHHIPVDRAAGSAAFRLALAALKQGEVIGVFPEATISRSFLLKDFKPGAARLAQATGSPMVPMVLWGSQRIYTKGRPRDWSRGKTIVMSVGEPLVAERRDDSVAVTEELKSRMAVLLEAVQRGYPDQPSGPDDRWWIPSTLGGTAPTLEQAARMDAEEKVERDARRAARGETAVTED